ASRSLALRAGAWRELQRFTGFQDAHGFTQVVRFQPAPKSPNRVVRARRYVSERAPVVRHQDAGPQPLEQGECVVVREMAAAEPRLPPRGIADRQQREIELPILSPDRALDKMMRVV